MGKLDGKVALVTGGASGIGLGIASLFAEEGARVTVTDVDAEGARAAADVIGRGARALTVDVSSAEQVARAVETTVAECGGLDVVANNAGDARWGALVEMPVADFERSIAVNLMGVYHGIRFAAPALTARGGGAIVNTSSVGALGGAPLLGAYCAAKAGVVQLTRVAALELRAAGIRVNALLPGFVKTGLVKSFGEVFDHMLDVPLDDYIAQRQARWGTPEDMAKIALHLVSDEAAFVTGQAYVADNGMSASVA